MDPYEDDWDGSDDPYEEEDPYERFYKSGVRPSLDELLEMLPHLSEGYCLDVGDLIGQHTLSDDEFEQLVAALYSPNPWCRTAVCYAISFTDVPQSLVSRVLGRLVQMLDQETYSEVAACVVDALGGCKSTVTVGLLTDIIRREISEQVFHRDRERWVVKDPTFSYYTPDPQVVHSAVTALGRIGDPQATSTLCWLLYQGEETADYMESAIEALGQFGSGADAVDALCHHVLIGGRWTGNALRAIGRICPPDDERAFYMFTQLFRSEPNGKGGNPTIDKTIEALRLVCGRPVVASRLFLRLALALSESDQDRKVIRSAIQQIEGKS